jgi:uncharacterized membrane protein HdeD (DUF308 family)
MAAVNPSVEQVRARLGTMLQSHWKSFLIEGILLLIFGIVAIVVPPLASFAIELIVGWVILFSGVAGLIATLRTRGTPGFGWSLFSAAVGITAGAVLLIWPFSGVLTLTLVVSAFLTIEGIASIMYALDHRRQKSHFWGSMLFSGITDLILSAIIFWGFPGTASWVIGLIVGINMIFGGTALIAMALQARGKVAPMKLNTGNA